MVLENRLNIAESAVGMAGKEHVGNDTRGLSAEPGLWPPAGDAVFKLRRIPP